MLIIESFICQNVQIYFYFILILFQFSLFFLSLPASYEDFSSGRLKFSFILFGLNKDLIWIKKNKIYEPIKWVQNLHDWFEIKLKKKSNALTFRNFRKKNFFFKWISRNMVFVWIWILFLIYSIKKKVIINDFKFM